MKHIFIFLIISLFFFKTNINAQALKEKDLEKTIKQCQDDRGQLYASGMNKDQYNKFCTCYVTNMVNLMTNNQNEIEYFNKNKKYSDQFNKSFNEIKTKCIGQSK